MKTSYAEATKTMEDRSKNKIYSDDLSSLDNTVLRVLKNQGPITRSDLVKKTGIPRSTLYDSLFRLMLKNLVVKYPDKTHSSRGRPQVFFEAKS